MLNFLKNSSKFKYLVSISLSKVLLWNIICRFNDESIIKGSDKKETKNAQCETVTSNVKIDVSKTEQAVVISDASFNDGVSSDADSDFIDVPEADADDDLSLLWKSKQPLPVPFLTNPLPLPDASKDFRLEDLKAKPKPFEIVINPLDSHDTSNDIFADIFKQSISEPPDTEECEVTVGVSQKTTTELPTELKSAVPVVPDTSSTEDTSKAPSASNKDLTNILNALDKEMTEIPKIDLCDLTDEVELPKENVHIEDKSISQTVLSEEKKNHIDLTTPSKIVQPFFVRKTPPSSKEKLQNLNDSQTGSPSKASKSLLEAFDSVPEPSVPKSIIREEDTIEQAAQILRENKTTSDLEEMAVQLGQEKRNLEAERNKRDRLGTSITEQMSIECMELLRLFGIPYIVAPMEAEAQCAFLNAINLTDGTITDDSDIWLFGGQTVYKNFFDQNKLVMEFQKSNIKKLFHIDRNEMIQLSILVGSDYTQGTFSFTLS